MGFYPFGWQQYLLTSDLTGAIYFLIIYAVLTL